MGLIVDVFAEPAIRSALSATPLTFVDVGAAVGVEEPWLSMLRAAPNMTRVQAFEPHPENFANISRLANGTYHRLAIAESNGRAKFYLLGTGSSLANRSAEEPNALPEIEVETRRLDSLREDGTIPSLDIIKTDAEYRDYDAIASAGRYLDTEVLAVQGEFGWQRASGERPFRDYDAMLGAAGFRLFNLSVQRGMVGEIDGGNFLYLRSIAHVLRQPAELARVQAFKLFAIAITLCNLGYAHAIAHACGDAGVFAKHETDTLHELCFQKIFVPDAMGYARFRSRLASAMGMVAHVAAGGYWSAVSTPESNRIGGYPLLFRRSTPLWRRSRVEQRYAAYYARYKKEQAL